MIEARLRSRIPQRELDKKVGRILTGADYNMVLTGPTRLYMPDGRLLCVYLPQALREEAEAAYPILTTIRGATDNRGLAAGAPARTATNKQTRTKPVTSSILGSFEPGGRYKFCRLTSWTSKEINGRWPVLLPLFQATAAHLAERVPDRYKAQMALALKTEVEWVVQGTPFTTITVNNSYPTGVHRDAGDLDEGFSCLAVARRGTYTGGFLTFPEYRVAVDMQDGDLLLMDAHQWHGNTCMKCECGNELGLSEGAAGTKPCATCGAERVSVVMYYRTNMAQCGTYEQEAAKAVAWAEKVNVGPAGAGVGLVDETLLGGQ